MGAAERRFRCRNSRAAPITATAAESAEQASAEEDEDLVAALHFLEESLQRDRTGLATVLGPVLDAGGTRVLGVWRTMLRWMPGGADDPVAMATSLLRRLGMSWGAGTRDGDDE